MGQQIILKNKKLISQASSVKIPNTSTYIYDVEILH